MYQFPITIDKTKVSGTNTNFPYLFSESCASIPAGFWSHVTDTTTGLDIRFFDTDGVTELKREVALYTPGTAKMEAWVQIPSLGTADNKTIYCQYGGPTRANDTTVWTDASARDVYHLQANANDSTGSTNGVVTGATLSDSKINKGYNLAGNDSDNISVTRGSAAHTGIYTVSAWVFCTRTVPNTNFACIIVDATQTFTMALSDGAFFGANDGWVIAWYAGSWYGVASEDTYASQLNSWNHVVGTYDGSVFKIYVNGVLKNTSGVVALSGSANNNINIGYYNGTYPAGWKGNLDEVRIYNVVKDISWVATEYANQNAPATFSSAGSEASYEEIMIVWM